MFFYIHNVEWCQLLYFHPFWICKKNLKWRTYRIIFLKKIWNKFLDFSLQLNAPLFITWYQCVVTVGLCCLLSALSKAFPDHISFPSIKIDTQILKGVCIVKSTIYRSHLHVKLPDQSDISHYTFNDMCFIRPITKLLPEAVKAKGNSSAKLMHFAWETSQ